MGGAISMLGNSMLLQRVIGAWNELEEEVVGPGTVTIYQRHVGKYLNGKTQRDEELMQEVGMSIGRPDGLHRHG